MIIYNKIIPFKGYKLINLCGIIFAKNGATISDKNINHEKIHSALIFEMFIIGFYLWYLIEWLIRLCINKKSAYRNISFEQEAYKYQEDLNYLSNRKHYTWIKFIK